jgi:hypothetical protein
VRGLGENAYTLAGAAGLGAAEQELIEQGEPREGRRVGGSAVDVEQAQRGELIEHGERRQRGARVDAQGGQGNAGQSRERVARTEVGEAEMQVQVGESR